jgi:hypothetical protein
MVLEQIRESMSMPFIHNPFRGNTEGVFCLQKFTSYFYLRSKLLIINVMKILAFVLFTFIIMDAQGQDCKYTKEKIDQFSGQRVRYLDLSIRMNSVLQLKKDGNTYKLAMFITFTGEFNDSARTRDTMLLKLENGKVLKVTPLNSTSNVTTSKAGNQTYIHTHFIVNYKVDESFYKDLSSSPLVAVRFVMGAIEYTIDVKGKKGKKAQEVAACLLN